MTMLRTCRWLLPVIALLALASCSDRMPNSPVASPTSIGILNPPPPPPPVLSGAPLDSALAASRARWNASGVSSYSFRFRWECYCVPEYVRTVDITVMNRAIVKVVDHETGATLDAEETKRYRTLDGLFDFVREGIDYPAASIQAAFDEGFGFPAHGYVDYLAGMADEEMGFRVYSMSPFIRQ